MAQNRNAINMNSFWLAPRLGEMVVGCNCARTNVIEVVQTVRFRTNQVEILERQISFKEWGQS